MDVKVDTPDMEQWRRAMRLWSKVKAPKAESEVVNHFAKEATWWAFKRTKMARLSGFPLGQPHSPKLVEEKRRGKKRRPRDQFYFALRSKARRDLGVPRREVVKRGKGLKDAAEREYRQRRSARGHMKSGWIKPMRDLGIKKSAGARARQPKGRAKRSWGKEATALNLEALVTNQVPNSKAIATPAMAEGMNIAAQRELNYVRKHMAKRIRQHQWNLG